MSYDIVSDSELLARFIVFKRWIRPADQTVKQNAFLPPSDLKLSVTRHLNISKTDIWNIGEQTVGKPPRELRGRADIEAIDVRKQNLDVESQPVDRNPNHANIVDWTDSKDAQKIRALAIAEKATFVAYHSKRKVPISK